MNATKRVQISAKTFRGSALQAPWLMCLALLAVLGFAPSARATTETLTGSGSWTVPAGVSSVTVEMWGGGGGGGYKYTPTSNAGRGGGGGGGGYSRATISVTEWASIAYSVGAGGAGGDATTPANAAAGGNTTFTGVTTANGGGAGANKVDATVPAKGTGGSGGTANGGDGSDGSTSNNSGGNGGGAAGWNGTAGVVGGSATSTAAGLGGGTGSSKGGGGKAAASGVAGGVPVSTNAPGGGGAAGSGSGNVTKFNGGAGADRTIILTYIAASSTPIVDTPTKSAITTTTATLGATVVTNSGNTIDDCGIVYSTTSVNNDPTVGGTGVTKVQKGTSIANGTAFTTNIVGLTAGTQYSFKGYAHTTSGYGYSTPASSFFTLANEPTVQASSASNTNTQRGAFAITWTRGNGANCIVLVKAGSAVDSAPVDGTTYTASTVFGSGMQIGSGNYVAYLGSGNSVTLSNMTIGTVYFVSVYELNGAGGSENYLTTSPATSSATATGNIYYSIGANPTAPSNWTNSLGFSPVNFNGGDTFVILSGQSITAADSWTNINGATLIIQSGATLDMFDATRKLVINGGFVNNGTLINSFDSSAPIVNFINAFTAGATTNFTSTLTVGTNYNVSVVAIGGGGGGASAGNPSNSIPVTGGGGGGGASAYSTNLVLQSGIAYQVTVGANGARATAGTGIFGNSGSAGGASSFGGGFLTSIVANGGGAGLASTFDGTNVTQGANGAGGAAGTTGNAGNYAGGNAAGGGGGGAAGDTGAGGNASGGTGGAGGTGSIASGGAGGSVTANTAGANAGAPGGGGSGANWTSGANKAGGSSGVGWVSVQFNSVDTSVSTANYKYQSRQNGNWNDFNTWSVDKGSGFVNAASGETPNSGHSSVLVQSGHAVTVAASAVTVNLTVTNGGTLTVSGGGLSVNRLTAQTAANNLTVYGTLNLAMDNALLLGNNTTNLVAAGAVLNQTAATVVSSGTGVQLTINGSYVQNVTGSGVIPVTTWGASSTCRIDSTFTSNIDAAANDVQLNYGQAFANFVWNAQGITTSNVLVVYRMAKSAITSWTVGNLTISNTAGNPAQLELTGTAAFITSVTNLTLTGGNFRAGGGGSVLTVNGPVAISAGTLDTGGTITALDNVSISGTADVTGTARFSFAKAGAQTWTVTTTNDLNGPSWTVNSGTALTLDSASTCVVNDLTVNGTLAVNGTLLVNRNGTNGISTNNIGSITVASGGMFGGRGGEVGASVTYSTGAYATNSVGFDTNGVVDTALTLTNALTVNGNTFRVNTGTNALAAGSYLLLTNTSIAGISGTFASTPVIGGAGLTGGATATVVTTSKSVTLQVSVSSDPPVITSTVLNGSNLIISGTNSSGTAGGTYYVRSTNDLTIPVANWPRISTNSYGVGGAFSVTNAVNPAVPQEFYRIEQ